MHHASFLLHGVHLQRLSDSAKGHVFAAVLIHVAKPEM